MKIDIIWRNGIELWALDMVGGLVYYTYPPPNGRIWTLVL